MSAVSTPRPGDLAVFDIDGTLIDSNAIDAHCFVAAFHDAWDVRAARALRLPFVGVGTNTTADSLRAAGATEVIPHFGDIAGVLTSMERARAPME